MNIRAIIFDLDDTLFCERAFVESGFRAVAKSLELITGLDAEEIMIELCELHHRSPSKVFDLLLQRHQDIDVSVTDLVHIYRTHNPTISLDPTVATLLRNLRSKYLLGIISDGHLETQQNKITALGLSELVDVICLSDMWGRSYWKPHERPFLYVLEKLGVVPKEACYVGDNLSKDFVAPNRLGMLSIHVAHTEGFYAGVPAPEGGRPHVTIHSLLELHRVLADAIL